MEASKSFESQASAEPRQGAFDDLAPVQNDKARQVGTSDDVDCQPFDVRNRCFELLPGIAAIGIQPDEGQTRIAGSLYHARRPVAALNIGAVQPAFQLVAERVSHDVTLVPLLSSFQRRIREVHPPRLSSPTGYR